ncbi:scaffolding protein [Yersinia sp. 2544 StPb PI]|uniref:scaffolding protein n=1 Tax=Yersinia sp. 2544 StPb PI TaxID=3117409 RepID=UPI003B27EF60
MEQQADNNTPENELDTTTPESIPDEVIPNDDDNGNDNGDDQNDGGSGDDTDDDDSEEEFYFGDEKLDSPTSNEDKDPALVKHLRSTIKEKDKELKELRRHTPTPQQAAPLQAPRMPQLSDDGIDYDEAVFQQKMQEWSTESARFQSSQAEQQRQQQQLQQRHQQKLQQYQERSKALKVPNYQQAEKAVLDDVPEQIQVAILHYAEKPELIVLALGRNAELRKQMADATDPVEVGRLIGIIESKAKTMPKAKSNPATTPAVKGGNGAALNSLDKLRAKAQETGDYSAVIAAKRKAKK